MGKKENWTPMNNVLISVFTAIIVSMFANVFTSNFKLNCLYIILIVFLLIAAFLLGLYGAKKGNVEIIIENKIQDSGSIGPNKASARRKIKEEEYNKVKNLMRAIFFAFLFLTILSAVIIVQEKYSESKKRKYESQFFLNVTSKLDLIMEDLNKFNNIYEKKMDEIKFLFCNIQNILKKTESKKKDITNRLEIKNKKSTNKEF